MPRFEDLYRGKPYLHPMVKLMSVIFITLILIILSSCCKERVCLSFEEIQSVEFFNYRPSDVDTIIFEIFSEKVDTGNRVQIDTLNLVPRGYRNHHLVASLPTSFIKGHWYRFIVPAVQDTFVLGNFETEMDKCRGGCGPNYDYEYLRSFTVNNHREYGSKIDFVNVSDNPF